MSASLNQFQAENLGFVASTCRERQLWCAVLNLILEDCATDLPDPSRRFDDRSGIRRDIWDNVTDARLIVAPERHHWRSVMCDLAGVNEERFVKHARLLVSLSS